MKIEIQKDRLLIRILFSTCIFCMIIGVLKAENSDSVILMKINELETVIQLKLNKIDTLESQYTEMKLLENDKDLILKLRNEKEYFTSIIKSQTAIFASITTGFFILFGLLTYGGFVREVKKQKKEYKRRVKKHQKRVNNLIKELELIKKSTYKNQGNTNRLISDFFQKEGNLILQFTYQLYSSLSFYKNTDESEAGMINLKAAVKLFKKISLLEQNRDSIKKKKDSIYKMLKEFDSFDKEEIRDLCAELRVMVSNFVKTDNP